ncbi:amidohydrolase family protein [Alkalilimnicola ehrlichii]|uniref:amidohydrolase family protein n=1 Tax=Alkalilimnicola ehrlichii TaxID=351052 RepID=UPI001C6F1F77|nr:amidohydrolase family protein [Alkalilimnicola ehrlichii]
MTPLPGEEVLDASGCVVYPGWVNTHHHLFQSVLKAVPEGINEPLFGWLGAVPYPRLTRIKDTHLETAATVGLVELLLSGTTTCADHHYLYYPGLDSEMADVLFEVADRLGMRLVLCRGGATEFGRHPGYPNDMAQESLDDIVATCKGWPNVITRRRRVRCGRLSWPDNAHFFGQPGCSERVGGCRAQYGRALAHASI